MKSPVPCTSNGTGMTSSLTCENSTVSVPVTVSFRVMTLGSEARHFHGPGLPESASGILAYRESEHRAPAQSPRCIRASPDPPACGPSAFPGRSSPRLPRPSVRVSCLPFLLLPWRAPCRLGALPWPQLRALGFHTGSGTPWSCCAFSRALPPHPCLPSSPPLLQPRLAPLAPF